MFNVSVQITPEQVAEAALQIGLEFSREDADAWLLQNASLIKREMEARTAKVLLLALSADFPEVEDDEEEGDDDAVEIEFRADWLDD